MKKEIYLKVVDHAVTKEPFELLYDPELEMLCTIPQPDDKDLVKYYESEDYISHTDSKRNWFEQIYQRVKKGALKRKVKLLNSVSNSPKTLLDIGCGTGDFLNSAKNNGWEVTGIEPNTKAREIANSKLGDKVFDNQHLNHLKTGSFRAITLWHVLEHLPDLDTQINRLKQLLNDNGVIIIAVPNYKSFDASYYKEFWAAYDVPRHLWHFSRSSIAKLFQNHGLEITKILPLKWDAYYVSLLSEKYKNGWMNIFSAFFIASRSNLAAAKSGEYSSLIYVLKKQK